MEDKEIVANARASLKELLVVNLIILALTIAGGYFGGTKAFFSFAFFYLLETLIFVVFFIPLFLFYLFKGRTIKFSAAKAMLCFGDF